MRSQPFLTESPVESPPQRLDSPVALEVVGKKSITVSSRPSSFSLPYFYFVSNSEHAAINGNHAESDVFFFRRGMRPFIDIPFLPKMTDFTLITIF